MKKLLFASLLLICLMLAFSACGVRLPAETTAEVTTDGRAPLSSSATTTKAPVTGNPTIIPDVFYFYTLSDFYLYMQENPADLSLYEIPPTFPYYRDLGTHPAKLIRLEQLLPSLSGSEQYHLDSVNGLEIEKPIYVQYGFLPGYAYSYHHNDMKNGGSINISVAMNSRDPDRDFGNYLITEWSEELECLLVKNKETGSPVEVLFYSLKGYEVEILLPHYFSSQRPEAQELLLASDVTELKEILEDPTLSCERLRIISETLRAMND